MSATFRLHLEPLLIAAKWWLAFHTLCHLLYLKEPETFIFSLTVDGTSKQLSDNHTKNISGA